MYVCIHVSMYTYVCPQFNTCIYVFNALKYMYVYIIHPLAKLLSKRLTNARFGMRLSWRTGGSCLA